MVLREENSKQRLLSGVGPRASGADRLPSAVFLMQGADGAKLVNVVILLQLKLKFIFSYHLNNQ